MSVFKLHSLVTVHRTEKVGWDPTSQLSCTDQCHVPFVTQPWSYHLVHLSRAPFDSYRIYEMSEGAVSLEYAENLKCTSKVGEK